MARTELGRFLRDRRQQVRPGDVGLPTGPRRRTPGLRREEVADLAGMSVDYYVRLEQARGPRPSPRILESLATALRLAPIERSHLFGLAGVVPQPPTGPPQQVRPYVTELLQRLPDTGVIVTAASYDVIAYNPLAEALLGDLSGQPNLARRFFLRPDQVRTTGGAEFAEIAVARLRAAATHYPHDLHLAALLAELRANSKDFNDIWATNPVHASGHRTKTLIHPTLGEFHINCDILTVPNDDQQVVFMTPNPNTPTARAIQKLVPR